MTLIDLGGGVFVEPSAVQAVVPVIFPSRTVRVRISCGAFVSVMDTTVAEVVAKLKAPPADQRQAGFVTPAEAPPP